MVMINELNEELRGVAMVFDEGPLQMLEFAQKAQSRPDVPYGAKISSNWDRCRKRIGRADAKKQKTVEDMIAEIGDLSDFAPSTRKRRRVWDETEGDINIDRALAHEAMMFRKMSRRRVSAPTNICIFANLDGDHDETEQSIFWRGAMAIALTNQLEELGFNITIWSWNVGHSVYQYPYDRQFTAVKLKSAGQDLDVMNLINTLSAWFMRSVMFATFAGSHHPCQSIGTPVYKMGEWQRYLDIDDEYILELPAVHSRQACIEMTHQKIKELAEC